MSTYRMHPWCDGTWVITHNSQIVAGPLPLAEAAQALLELRRKEAAR